MSAPGVLAIGPDDAVHGYAFGSPRGGPGSLIKELDACQEALDEAVAGAVEWVADPRTVTDPWPTRLTHLWASPPAAAPGLVEDTSFQLAAALWRAARWMGTEVPRGTWASATVDRRGEVGPVRGLERKSNALPAGDRLIVARSQRHEVVRTDIDVLGVSTLKEAVGLVFAGHDFPRVSPEVAEAAWVFALRTTSRRPWRPIADGLARIGAQHPSLRLEIAASIARRHAGAAEGFDAPVALMRQLPAATRIECAAHVMQGYADGALHGWRAAAIELETWIPSDDDLFPQHAKLLGALGRAHAAWRCYEDAVRLLDRAIEAWFRLHSPADASHSLCERLRIDAIVARREGRTTPSTDVWHHTQRAFTHLQRNGLDTDWITAAIARFAGTTRNVGMLQSLHARFPEAVGRTRWWPAAALNREEDALRRLFEAPDDEDALRALHADPMTRTDYVRFASLLGRGERLGHVLAVEWRY